MWIILSIFSALVLGGKRVYEKHLTGFFGNFSMGFAVQAFAVIPIGIMIFCIPDGLNIGTLSWQFWWPLIVIWIGLYPIQIYLLYRATREGEVSVVVPMMAFLPVLNMVTSFFLLHEVPSKLGIGAIVIVVIATYLMLWKKKSEGGFSKPVLLMLGSLCCMAIGSSLDKVAMQATGSPVFYTFMNNLGASVMFFILMHFYNEHASFGKMKKMFWPLTILGILQAVSFTAAMYAFTGGPTSYSLAIRSGGYVLAGLWGVWVMKESITHKKIFAICLFALGIVLLAFA